jgi:VanZ family protein
VLQKLYKYIFWFGYLAVLITSLIRVPGDLNRTELAVGVLKIQLDKLLHLVVYSLIVIYFLARQWKGLVLFRKNALLKFIIVILLLSTLTEVVQLWVPTRNFNPLDWLSNVAGGYSGGWGNKTTRHSANDFINPETGPFPVHNSFNPGWVDLSLVPDGR